VVGGITGEKKSQTICKRLEIKITVRDIRNPAIYIFIIVIDTKKNSLSFRGLYGEAQEILSVLQMICDSRTVQEQNTTTALSAADEILKFKNLLDSGIISQVEFETKKEQLLGL